MEEDEARKNSSKVIATSEFTANLQWQRQKDVYIHLCSGWYSRVKTSFSSSCRLRCFSLELFFGDVNASDGIKGIAKFRESGVTK